MGTAKQIDRVEVAILGAGPAGLALAAAMAERGLATAVLAPEVEIPWRQSYGLFAHSLRTPRIGRFGLERALRSRHSRPLVWLGEHDRRAFDAPYLRFDTARLQFGLLDAVKALGVRLVDAHVDEVVRAQAPARGSYVLGTGVEVAARYVFDATEMLRIRSRNFRQFLCSFFDLPAPLWLAFMNGEQRPHEVLMTLWRLFRTAPSALRFELLRAATRFATESVMSLTEETPA